VRAAGSHQTRAHSKDCSSGNKGDPVVPGSERDDKGANAIACDEPCAARASV